MCAETPQNKRDSCDSKYIGQVALTNFLQCSACKATLQKKKRWGEKRVIVCYIMSCLERNSHVKFKWGLAGFIVSSSLRDLPTTLPTKHYDIIAYKICPAWLENNCTIIYFVWRLIVFFLKVWSPSFKALSKGQKPWLWKAKQGQ